MKIFNGLNLNFLKDKSILITGGTGSFGKNFVKFLLASSEAKKIIVFSRDEHKQFQMQKELDDKRLRFFLGDIRDLQRLERAFNRVDIVVHAAALKQVPMLEYNPYEAVKTNILGSQNVIDAAIDQRVEKVLLISTDKAALPVNLYGSTKLCAEKLFVSGNFYAASGTKFSAVRYGNVIGSRGSVVDVLLKNQNNKKVFVTHKDMTRFWIHFNKAFELVVYALENMVGGEIFIPKIPSMNIVDLFDALAPKAKKEVIGIRPGEKLHEMLLTSDEARHSIELKEYFVILPENQEINVGIRYKKILAQGKKIKDGFCYSSDNNKKWLTASDLKKLIK